MLKVIAWMGRHLKIAKWIYRGIIVLLFIVTALGYGGPEAAKMSWLVGFEGWLTDHTRDPIVVAFLSGLILSTWLIPDVWTWSKKHLIKGSQTKLEVSGPHLLPDHVGHNRWRFRVRNHGPTTANNVQMRLRNVDPRPKYGRWQADYPYPVSRVGKKLDEPPSRINVGDEEDYEVKTWRGSDENLYASLDTKDVEPLCMVAIEPNEVSELKYELTAENAERVIFSMQMSVKDGAVLIERKG